MSYRTIIVILTACSLSAAGKKGAPAKNENETVEIIATATIDRESIKQLLGSDLDGHYIIVDVQVTPRFGKELEVRRDDFLLRTDKDGERTTPFVPSQIAGKGALVVSQTGSGRGGMMESGPSWGGGYPGGPMGGPPVVMGPGSSIGGGGGDPGGAEARLGTGSKDKESPLLKLLAGKMLQEKKTESPVSGLLYFPMEKQKLKDLELIYTSPGGKLSLRFK